MTKKDWIEDTVKGILDAETELGYMPRLRPIIEKHCPFKPDTVYVELINPPEETVQDWALRCAAYLNSTQEVEVRPERLAAIIVTFAEPIITLLNETRRSHSDTCYADLLSNTKCTCGQDAWSKRVEEALR